MSATANIFRLEISLHLEVYSEHGLPHLTLSPSTHPG